MPAKKKRRRRKPARRVRARPGALTALLALVAAGAVVAAVLSLGTSTPSTLVSERTVTVEKGVIESVVSGSGNLAPARQADDDFATSGKITKIYTAVGMHVSTGELLARVDDRSQRVDVAKAEADVVDAQDALTKAQDAEAAATATPTATAVAVVAQATPAATARGPQGSPTPQATATAAPRATATPAQSQGGGGSTQSVASAQAQVDSADLALSEAQDALADTRLRAPMAGTVASISGAVGDTAGSGQSGDSSSVFIVLAALSKLKLDVSLSESDIGKVKAGQSATVTINAASGEKVAGHVTSVGVLANSDSSGTSSGAVSYPVTVTLDQSSQGVRAGMSATADIVVARASGLVVPSQALRGNTVTVTHGGRRSTERVQTGVVGDSTTQVVSGLNAGDRVIVTSTSVRATGTGTANSQTRTGFGGGFGGGATVRRFGGGGGFGGGGAVPRGGPGG
jgi:multidrug efflux pump subunit AcrA (membrane-fusion protein)